MADPTAVILGGGTGGLVAARRRKRFGLHDNDANSSRVSDTAETSAACESWSGILDGP